ncbi:MAG TPA: hypothetical protein VGG44_08750 [Tepidisphaeraceae bacterium]|jgi:hypothetical protein
MLVLAVSISLAAGCELAGVAIDRASGGPTVKAKYVPVPTDSMLVLVESYGLALDSGIEAEHLTMSLGKALTDSKVAPILNNQKLERLKDIDPHEYHKMTIADIGRRLGVKQVLYVNITRADIMRPVGGGQVRGHMEATVKIVDSASAETRWPTDSASEAVQITTNWIPDNENKTESDVRAQMSDQMADDIGKLFHEYNLDAAPMPPVNIDEH